MTRRSSVRAQARRNYRDMAAAQAADPPSLRFGGQAPLPNPHLQAGKEQAGEETDLTARARALYEDSAVPVREIAAVAGVTERTIYKYAAKHGWKSRYRWAQNRGWRARSKFAPAKGAGGRFIRREDKDQPFATGLKALDPAGAARAAADCREAERVAHAARAEAEAEQRTEQLIRAFDDMNRAAKQLTDTLAERNKQSAARRRRVDDLLARGHSLSLDVAIARCEFLVAEGERADRCGEEHKAG
jgi:hypothetical protein